MFSFINNHKTDPSCNGCPDQLVKCVYTKKVGVVRENNTAI